MNFGLKIAFYYTLAKVKALFFTSDMKWEDMTADFIGPFLFSPFYIGAHEEIFSIK